MRRASWFARLAVVCSVLLVSAPAFPAPIIPPPLDFATAAWIEDDAENVILALTHGGIRANVNHPPTILNSPSGFWQVGLTISEIDRLSGCGPLGNQFCDHLIVLERVQHIKGVPGHVGEGPGPIFMFTLEVDAFNAVGNRVVDAFSSFQPHLPSHEDRLVSFLDAVTLHVGNNNDIVLFNLTTDVTHVVPEPIPEPSTLFLFGSSLAALSGIAWRRHRRK